MYTFNKVFGLGVFKTGTTSLSKELINLGGCAVLLQCCC
jgi:hypothetical protein